MIEKTKVDDRELERIQALMREVVRKSSRRDLLAQHEIGAEVIFTPDKSSYRE